MAVNHDNSDSEFFKPPSAVAYGLTVAAVGLATLFHWLLDPILGDQLPYPTFFVAVIVAAWIGGLRPALLASAMNFFVAWYCFIPSRFSLSGTSGVRILVVDDNQDSAKSLAMLLKIFCHDMHTAHDGRDELEAAEKLRPDVVLLDIGLPKLNGHDVCRRIREQPWGKEMVLVALTGWGQDDDRRKSQDAGFDHYMVKPVEFGALLTFLARRFEKVAG
jgi:CheY-like chemotaxis protein